MIETADIVQSLCGHDTGSVLFVVGVDGEFVLLADGKRRRMEKPKKKKAKHVRFLSKGACRVAIKLSDGARVTNNELRRALREFAESKQTT